MTSDALILIVGGADTGRAPMTAALLRRLLGRQGIAVRVESAGVVGHDGDPAEPEARDAMLALGLDIAGHTARSLDDDLAAAAGVLVAIDTGVARVLRARHPGAAVVTLGGLAGRERDIPDPFRMQIGAWLQYAAEIDALLSAGLPRLRAMLEGDTVAPPAAPTPAIAPEQLPAAPERVAAAERATRLLGLLVELPDVVEWPGASRQLAADLAVMERPMASADLARPYVALLRAALALLPGRPTAAQAAVLRAAVSRLRAPVGPADLDALAAELTTFGGPPA